MAVIRRAGDAGESRHGPPSPRVPAAMPTAVFLDKDGTLLDDVPYNVDPSQMRLAPGGALALARLGALGVPLAVISNQPGVALGRFDERDLEPVRQALAALFAQHGARLAGFYYCPHHPAGSVERYRQACACRKPAAGLLLRAARELGVDLAGVWMVGDILDDIEAGLRAGCRTVLVDCGNETEWHAGPCRTPHAVVSDIAGAADIIASAAGRSPRREPEHDAVSAGRILQ